jgi:phosphoglycolate phosphatase-like HAD superfamily hydrolase
MDAVLFDIDGTLIGADGAGRQAITQAALELYGLPGFFDGIRFDGGTDRGICRAALARGLPERCNDAEIDRLLAAYVAQLEKTIASARYQIFPGVERLLGVLAKAGTTIGLGTGNVERGARIKLERGGLNPHFAFGGFGDDAEERSLILRRGLERAERLSGRPSARPWVVGDTPLDLQAARKVGARVILVATGSFGFAELESCKPELCVETLEDPRVEHALTGD